MGSDGGNSRFQVTKAQAVLLAGKWQHGNCRMRKNIVRTPKSATSYERVRSMIRAVPRGKVSTYGAIAAAAGYPGGARLVARVLGASHGLPWQRILGAGGEIKLPGEAGMEQRFRLEMEGVTFRGRRVQMKLHEHHFRNRFVKPDRRALRQGRTSKSRAR